MDSPLCLSSLVAVADEEPIPGLLLAIHGAIALMLVGMRGGNWVKTVVK
jgi:hypothetical protein